MATQPRKTERIARQTTEQETVDKKAAAQKSGKAKVAAKKAATANQITKIPKSDKEPTKIPAEPAAKEATKPAAPEPAEKVPAPPVAKADAPKPPETKVPAAPAKAHAPPVPTKKPVPAPEADGEGASDEPTKKGRRRLFRSNKQDTENPIIKSPKKKFWGGRDHETDTSQSPDGLEEHLDAVAEDLGLDPDRPINRIPKLKAGVEEVDRRIIVPDHSLVRITYDTIDNQHLYDVIEPVLSERELTIHAFLRETMVRTLDGRHGDGDWGNNLRYAIEEAVLDHDIQVDRVSLARIQYHIRREFLGYGPIEVLMNDPMLEDISCDGPTIPIYVFHREYGSIRSSVSVDDETTMDRFVIRLAQRSGKHISIAEPLLDATLPDGSRLQTSLGREVTSHGSTFTVRKFRAEPMTAPDLVAFGTMDPAMAGYFWFIMEEGRSLLYAGGTASGKTTSLNAVCQFIPPTKKVVSIEDTREINLMHENWIPGITRAGFGNAMEGGQRAGSIDMYRLLEAALRQRPEYLLVGEVRGKEALTLFQAMATGHAVYSTMHADSVKSAVYRLENPPINVPRMMLQTLDTVAIQAQVKVGERAVRRIKEVVEIIGFDPDTEDLLTNTVFRWDAKNDKHQFTGHSEVFDQIMEKRGWTDADIEKRWTERIQLIEYMRQEGIRDLKTVSGIFHEYYRRPDTLFARLGDKLPHVSIPRNAEDTWD